MTKNTNHYSFAPLVKENEYNIQFEVGDEVTFFLNELQRTFNGTVEKKYTNSCLLDITDNQLSVDETRFFQGKLVVSYKELKVASYMS